MLVLYHSVCVSVRAHVCIYVCVRGERGCWHADMPELSIILTLTSLHLFMRYPGKEAVVQIIWGGNDNISIVMKLSDDVTQDCD